MDDLLDLIGEPVLLFQAQDRAADPAPGVITAAEGEFVEVAAFFPKNSRFANFSAIERVALAKTEEDLPAAYTKGTKFVALFRKSFHAIPVTPPNPKPKPAKGNA